MSYNFNNIIFDDLIATNTTNYREPTTEELKAGIQPNTEMSSELINSFLYKASSSIKQIQENGAIQYIPGKTYNTGNIITCSVVINNRLNVLIFRCKNDNVTSAPLDGMVTNDDNGFIYFTTTDIDTDNWERVNTSYNLDVTYSTPEWSINSTEQSVNDFKIFKLYDANNLNYSSYINSSFNLTIKRDEEFVTLSVNIIIKNNKIDIFIGDVYSTTYNLENDDTLFNSLSKFKYVGLMGSFFMLDNNKRKLYLVICPRKIGSIIENKNIFISLSSIENTIRLNIDKSTEINPLNANNFKVYFIERSSSLYDKTYELYSTYEELDYDESFKRGLVLLNDSEVEIDPVIYSFKTLTSYSDKVGSVFLKANDDMYTSYINSRSYLEAPEYTEYVKDIKYIEAQCNQTSFTVFRPVSLKNRGDLDGIFSSRNIEYYGFVNTDLTDGKQNTAHKYSFGSGNAQIYSIKFNASRANQIYTKEVSDRFFMKSIKVFRYMSII